MRQVAVYLTIAEITLLLSSLASLIEGSRPVSAFLLRNYTPVFSTQNQRTTNTFNLFSSRVIAMVETPPIPRREEDLGTCNYFVHIRLDDVVC